MFRAEDGALHSLGGGGLNYSLFRATDGRPSKGLNMFYAYILQSVSRPEQVYRGHTTDLKQRLSEHNAGKCSHTAKFIPWKLRFYAAFETLELAQHWRNSSKPA
jgi:predicted GIY-YIG superfamily endonuclease